MVVSVIKLSIASVINKSDVNKIFVSLYFY